jgi:hypothetical protein
MPHVQQAQEILWNEIKQHMSHPPRSNNNGGFFWNPNPLHHQMILHKDFLLHMDGILATSVCV